LNEFNIINPITINWIYEEQLTLKELIYKKHDISLFKLSMNRIMFFILFLVIFSVFWELVEISANVIQLKHNLIDKYFYQIVFIFNLQFQLMIILYSNIAISLKNVFNTCICCGIAIIVIVIVVKEIIYLL
jgi:hypothetical protein